MTTRLSDEQKATLYRDGYVVVPGAVAPDLVAAAQARLDRAGADDDLSGDAALTDLVNRSSVTPVLTEAMGPFDPPSCCQVAVNEVRAPRDAFVSIGYRDRDLPYRGAEVHLDGLLTIRAPQEPQAGTPEEICRRYVASGPRGDLGRSADVMGHNLTPLFQDPAATLAIGSFTAFVFVCLSDQTAPGVGQTAVLPGGHHATEAFFRWQRAQGLALGPEGPGWPRLDHDAPNRCGLVYLPPAVRDRYVDETSERTPDGRAWPRPTPVLMRSGDVCLAVHQLPHTVTRNELGTEARRTIIFRLRAKARQPHHVAAGNSDHPDRGWRGEWLDHEPGNDPWERSRGALCDPWSEWAGMVDAVAAERTSAHG